MGFIGKRLIITLITLFLVSLLSFLAFRLIPGDPALLALGMEATEEQLIALRAEMGLDRSLTEQYLAWLSRLFTGRLGESGRFMGVSVSRLILERLPVTFSLAGISLIFIILISVPVSLLSVNKENSIVNSIVTTLTAMGISTPGFFMGVALIWVFGIVFRVFVPGAYISYTESYSGFIGSLIFPALAIAIPNAALIIKFFRASLVNELKGDYVRTAKSKGGSRYGILKNHVFKNASLPIITLLGMIVGEIFSGSIVIEQVFGIPGIGRLLISSITSRDYPVIETLMIYIAFSVIMANTLADISLQIIDPRIRLGKGA
ncbi:MAG: ABC transporter permease [Treponema sp.]|nr:ABC transporter permease [Treponema sp.]